MLMGGDVRVAKQRGVEGSALATLVEASPKRLTVDELIDAMSVEGRSPERAAAIEIAVAGLVESGLLQRSGGELEPSKPALRAAELEMGLG
jgi:hypothetical protein